MDAGSPSKTFLGVRFFLFGFNPVTERQVRGKLIDGGGVGVGQYDRSCTHVIVDKKIVYDDPICVAARDDGKTLVTGLWVDHSYDLGVQVDPLSMMYRPLRDLNGIPGAKSLIMCLTGYQRHDREDIMTMVGLMGAQFSKPLVANKITHLICYKFEGEKYELAKKMKRIKLVNHRWLEDCLRDWELLPEADYNKSGIELDMMETEAKDSDEETEEPAVKQSSIRRSPHDSKLRMLSATELPKLAMEVPNPTFPEDPVGAKAKEVFPAPGKLNRSSPNSNNAKTPGAHGRQETGASVEVPAKHQECQNSKIDTNVVSMSKREEKYSPDAKFTAVYSEKTPKKPALQGFSGESSGNISGSLKAVRPDDSSDFSPKMFQEKGKFGSGCTVSPLKASSLHHGEDSAHVLPQKRQIDIEASARGSKSPKTSLNATATIEKSPDLNVVTKSNESDAKKLSSADENSTKNDPTCLLDVFGNEQNGNAEKSPMLRRELRESSESKSTAGKLSMRRLSHSVGKPMALENNDLDEDTSPSGRKAETQEPRSPVELDLVEGVTDKSSVKSVKKKTLPKKTLGSRPKKTDIASRKGSIYSNKVAPEDDAAVCFGGVEERAAATGGNTEEASPSTVSNVAGKDDVAKAVGSNADSEAENVDDETEAPDENNNDEFEKTLNEKKSENVDDETEAPDRLMEEARNEPDNNLAVEEAQNDEDTKLGGPASESASKGETKQVRKRLSVKAKNKTAPAEPENNLAVEEAQNGKEVGINVESVVSSDNSKLGGPISESAFMGKTKQVRKKFSSKAKNMSAPAEPENNLAVDEARNGKENEINLESVVSSDKTKLGGPISESASMEKTMQVGKKLSSKAKKKTVPADPENNLAVDEARNVKENGINLESVVSSDKTKLGGPISESASVGKTKHVGKKLSSKARNKTAPADPENNLAVGEARNVKENGFNLESVVSSDETKLGGPISESASVGKTKQVGKKFSSKARNKTAPADPENNLAVDEARNGKEDRIDLERVVSSNKTKWGGPILESASMGKTKQVGKKLSSKARNKTAPADPENNLAVDERHNEMDPKEDGKENPIPQSRANKNSSSGCARSMDKSVEEEHEAVEMVDQKQSLGKRKAGKSVTKLNKKPVRSDKVSGLINSKAQPVREVPNQVKNEPMSFLFSGHRFQRKEFRQVIKSLKGRCCKDSHQWSYQATHFVVPDPVRRTEKFFAAAASGRWILKTDYLTACSKAGKFLPEEPYEWHNDGLNDDGNICLEAPRKWRLLRERTGHGAFYGMQIVVYGACIAPSLDTMKRVVKAGDGTILATSPPYTRFLNSGIDFAIVSPGIAAEDSWVKEFIKHEIPCVSVDYLVEYICKPGHPLDHHVLYKTNALAKKSLANIERKANVIAKEACASSDDPDHDHQSDDIACRVCGSCDREEVMIICGDESGAVGCGAASHIDCCDPPLEAIPDGDWFCPECSSKSRKNVKSSKRKRGASSSSLKRKGK